MSLRRFLVYNQAFLRIILQLADTNRYRDTSTFINCTCSSVWWWNKGLCAGNGTWHWGPICNGLGDVTGAVCIIYSTESMYLVLNELTMVRTESSDTSLSEPTHILKLFTMLHKLYTSQYGHLYFTVTSPYIYIRTTTNSKYINSPWLYVAACTTNKD